ncbi:MAG TPA: sensor domain-containing diguanylate cyclase [candidate division WOR-3 bacterium]|uniref:Sensor domain-containing diguanylate cyclase n=1 Tax=candidate division WOR-3 bacterium TaxID=2052148 RepID=A0A9C9EM29_UNCW3|nr:sensor domain-containing diguanylate cyclase [candidate division WOR-3 bacterium]
MDTGTFINILLGAIIVTIAIILIATLSKSKKKSKVLNHVDILADELDRHKKENLHLQAELKRINSMDNLFFASMIRLTSRLNPSDIAKEITGLLMHSLDAEEVAVFLADPEERRLTIIDQRGLKDDWIPKLVYDLRDEKTNSKVTFCFLQKHPITKRDHILGLKEPYPIFNPDICYPIFFQEKKFGVIAITRKQNLEERERNLLGVVSGIAGVALNNTRSFADITLTAHTDPLTRLFNIGYFRDKLDKELNRAKRFQHNLAVSIIDLDNFKTYNDTYGHQAGDHLLIQLSHIFKKHFDEMDTLARYGGDEFIVMCPEINKQELARIIGNLLHDLEMYDFTRGEKKVKVTFSAGVSSYPDDATNGAELIKLADQALYEAKGAGRNLVRVYHPKVDKI